MITDSNNEILIGQKYHVGSQLKYWRYQLNANGTAKVKLFGEANDFDVIVRNDNFIPFHVVLIVFAFAVGEI